MEREILKKPLCALFYGLKLELSVRKLVTSEMPLICERANSAKMYDQDLNVHEITLEVYGYDKR